MSRYFDGVDERIDWASIHDLAGGPLTISLWAKITSFTVYDYLFCMHNTGDAAFGIIFSMVGSQTLQFLAEGATDLYRYNDASGINIAGLGWFNAVVTWDGTFTDATKIHIYVNGAEWTGGEIGRAHV